MGSRLAALWIEPRPHPLVMSDTEILNWLNEHLQEVAHSLQTPNYPAGFTVKCYGMKTKEPSLREAVCMAAAKWDEVNS